MSTMHNHIVLVYALAYAALQKPKTLHEAVEKLVALKLEDVRQGLTADYAAKASALAARIEHLQQQLQQPAQPAHGPAAAAGQSASGSSHGGRGSVGGSRMASAGSRVASAKPAAS